MNCIYLKFVFVGHELPYSIKMSQLRDSYQSKNGDVSLPSNEEILDLHSSSNIEFILKTRKSSKKANLGKCLCKTREYCMSEVFILYN